MAQAVVDLGVIGISLGVRDYFGCVADMLPVHLAKNLDGLFLVKASRRIGGERVIDEVIEAGELAQTVLAPELVEARDAVLAVANYVERDDVDLPGRRVETGEFEVLQERRRVVEFQKTKALPSQGEGPIGRAAFVHELGSP